MKNLVFREDDHSYWLGDPETGVSLVSVTRILADAGLVRTDFFTPQSAQRGTTVHKMTEDYDSGLLDESTVEEHPHYPYLCAWKRFVEDHIVKFSRIEWRLCHADMGYAGTVDRVGTVMLPKKNSENRSRQRCVIDIKSGSPRPEHRIQLSAYAGLVTRALVLSGESPIRAQKLKRLCVYITKEGKYRIIEHTDDADEVMWSSALRVAKYRRFHNLV
jgi:hypothetical protein